MIQLYEYDTLKLSTIILFSVFSFWWVIKIPVYKIKIFYIMLVSFLLIYSGVGGAIKEVDNLYVCYYIAYALILSITLYYYYKRFNIGRINKESIRTYKIDTLIIKWIDRYGAEIIILYFVFLLFDLIYPTFRLQLLLSPPSPSLDNLHYKTFVLGNTKDYISQSVYLVQQFIVPFFYLSLYKYRNKLKMTLILLLLPVYIDLCNRGIIGRGQVMIPVVIVLLVLYENLNSTKSKIILITGILTVPILSYVLVQFSFLRIGADFADISFSDSLQILFGQEIAYPLHFNEYIGKSNPIGIMEYVLWIVLLPLPGFLKFGYGDPQINMKFTMLVTGIDPTQSDFSISLPGLIGESLIIFGQYLFPLHAIILGTIISYLIKYLSKCDSYKFLYFFVATIFSYNICRGGTASAYSFAFKQFLLFLFFIYYIKRKNRKYL